MSAFHEFADRLLRQSLKSTLRRETINHDESRRFPSEATLIGKSGELLGYLTVSEMEYKAISSQAFSGGNEGSTTNSIPLDQ